MVTLQFKVAKWRNDGYREALDTHTVRKYIITANSKRTAARRMWSVVDRLRSLNREYGLWSYGYENG